MLLSASPSFYKRHIWLSSSLSTKMFRLKLMVLLATAAAAALLLVWMTFSITSSRPRLVKPVRIAHRPVDRSDSSVPLCDNQLPPSAPVHHVAAVHVPQVSDQASLQEDANDTENVSSSSTTIFMITPTYARSSQKADLTRLCQTLMHVDNLCWVVIEDSEELTPLVTRLLQRCKVWSVQLYVKTPPPPETKKRRRRRRKKRVIPRNRGGEQRNVGLQWLRDSYEVGEVNGVVYFGDDDNTYDLRVFEEMRTTKRVAVWPVGLVGGLGAEGPVCDNDTVVDWHTSWATDRKFPLDFAGFSIHIDILLGNPKILVNPKANIGFMETDYLEQAVQEKEELEPKAENCTQVLVWHTQTKIPALPYEKKNPSNMEF